MTCPVNLMASTIVVAGLAAFAAGGARAQVPLEKATVAGWAVEATASAVGGFTDCRASKANPDGDRLVFLSRPDGSSGVALTSAKLKLPDDRLVPVTSWADDQFDWSNGLGWDAEPPDTLRIDYERWHGPWSVMRTGTKLVVGPTPKGRNKRALTLKIEFALAGAGAALDALEPCVKRHAGKTKPR